MRRVDCLPALLTSEHDRRKLCAKTFKNDINVGPSSRGHCAGNVRTRPVFVMFNSNFGAR